MKFVPSRIRAAAALAAALAGGCATSQSSTSAAGESPATRDRTSVATCYSTGYRSRFGFAPVLDDKTDVAADAFLKKYSGSSKRACDAISAALSTPSCSGGNTLGSLITCDHRLVRTKDIDPAAKAALETRVRENDQQDLSQGKRAF